MKKAPLVAAVLYILCGTSLAHADTTFTQSLAQGSSGLQVSALQTLLKAQGFFTADVTGYFGPVTAQAVASFQTAHGLEAVGAVGPLTRAALNQSGSSSANSNTTQAQAPSIANTSATPVLITRSLDVGAKGTDVSTLQQFLKQQGYLQVDPTGYFGVVTKAAVAAFQKANGLEAVGGVGPQTRALILRVSNAGGQAAASPQGGVPTSGGGSSGGSAAGSPSTITNYIPPTFSGGGGGSSGSSSGGGGGAPSSSAGSTPAPSTSSNSSSSSSTSSNTSSSSGSNTQPSSGSSQPTTPATSSTQGGSGTSAPPADITPPSVTITAPITNLAAGTIATALAVLTNEAATCAYSTNASAAFAAMTAFGTTGNLSHVTTLASLINGTTYSYYVKCKDLSGNISGNASVSFSVANPAVQSTTDQTTTSPTSFTTLLNNKTVSLFGYSWGTQSSNDGQAGASRGLATDAQGTLYVDVKSGEHASFDPIRKMRAEIGSARTFGKQEVVHTKFDLYIEPYTNATGLEWNAPTQIHQADSRFANGVPVSASPWFGASLFEEGAGKMKLVVEGETSTGIPAPNTFAPARILGTRTGVTKGAWHTLEYEVVDGHGGPGRISFWFDGTPIVDRSDIPTGYEYVDLLTNTLIGGKPQSSSSYIKMGVYAGLGSGTNPPPATATVGYRFRNVSIVYLNAKIPSPTQNVPFSWTPTVTGTTGPVTWNFAGSLPPGLTFSTATGAITGTPTTQSPIVGTVSVTDSRGTTATLPQTVQVIAAGGSGTTPTSTTSTTTSTTSPGSTTTTPATTPSTPSTTTTTPSPSPTPAPSTSGDVTTGLVAYYPFSEGSGKTVADSSGNGNVATFIRGAESTAWSSGKVGGGLLIGTTSQNVAFLNAPNSASLGGLDTDQTIAFWVKGNNGTVTSGARFISKRSGSGWTIAEMPNLHDLYMRIDTSVATNQSGGIISGVLDGSWHHVAWVLSSGSAQLYKDGALVTTATYNGTSLANTSPLNMMFADGAVGSIDNVRVYNRTLSATDISTLYSSSL